MRKATVEVGNKRLLKLAEFLETKVPAARFDLAYWVDPKTWKGKADLSCGTSACAMGWATTMPYFKRLGLYVESDHGSGAHLTLADDRGCSYNWEVPQALFRIDELEALELFDAEYFGESEKSPATPKQVAKRIRAFVKRRAK